MALTLNRLAESAGALSGAVVIRAACLAVPPRWEEGAPRGQAAPTAPCTHPWGCLW